ncbi:hypothetical protein ACLSZ3_08970 [Avibacterium gallinarum]|uniref:hypothetical protein n=1 Tax=Avibacterium gallinarum TaxID=755 RepID=UPI0039FC82B3
MVVQPNNIVTFSDMPAPNTTWNANFKGQFLLGNKKWCYSLTISDNFSRFLLLYEGLPNTKSATVIRLFEQLIDENSLTHAIRLDILDIN